MALRLILLVALLAAPTVHANEDDSVNGVQKVIAMLQDMAAKAKQEKKDEEVAFAKFSMWCSKGEEAVAADIKKEGEQIELLTAGIQKLESDVSVLGDEIMKLKTLVEKSSEDLKAQEKERAEDHKSFLAEQEDYAQSVSALERAIAVMQKQNYDRKGAAASLIQLSNEAMLPDQAKSMVAAFLGMMSGNDPELLQSMGMAPEANAYEFQSSGIVDMLKKLLADFTEKKGTCEKEEMNSQLAFKMIEADLTDSIENAKKDIEEKIAEKESKKEKAATQKKDLKGTADSKTEDEGTLTDMKADCAAKKSSFEEKQQLRSEEIEAIAKAVEILQGEGMSFLQISSSTSTSLLQVSSKDSAAPELSGSMHRRIREFILKEGNRLRSKNLVMLSEKMAADPFAKIKKLIDDMITKLLEEANADAEKEGFCDKELGMNKITREKLSKTIDSLTAAVEDGKATIMELTQEIAMLNKEVSELQGAISEATQMRKDEKAKNEATVDDSVKAQKAVEAATSVLKDFYEKAGKATAFVQLSATRESEDGIKMGSDEWKALGESDFDKGHQDGDATFGDKFNGQQEEAGGVLALLEVILSDFANVETDTKSAEAASQKAFEDFKTEAKKNIAMKDRKVEMDNSDKVDAESKLREDVADLKSTQDELLAADRYYEKLVPQCLDKGPSYEEKKAAREKEIQSLKQALEIISSQ
eukprot:gnl/TRDRNA2_/TRDRNA2_177345_c17_seq4.p1 gnl/TRDRNA2_/TRDRNA2_177345_c17~~gnl/TRDRNA2_/TRDRNA2_177345_c17_seq4.p1  ORF type:complete len:700 (+),score=285.71 gnl/TRDRNA2_/TRDRNA2_177345_c17_seq4:67-2166(+)